MAVNFGLNRVVLESDCLDLVRCCRREIRKGEILNVVEDTIGFANSLPECGFLWVPKEGNHVAHTIAQLNSRGALPLHWRWYHPRSCRFLSYKINNGSARQQKEVVSGFQ